MNQVESDLRFLLLFFHFDSSQVYSCLSYRFLDFLINVSPSTLTTARSNMATECQSCTLLAKQRATLTNQLRTQQLWLNRVQSEFVNQQSLVEHQKARFQENNAQILKSNIKLQSQLDAAVHSRDQLRGLNESLKDRLSMAERNMESLPT